MKHIRCIIFLLFFIALSSNAATVTTEPPKAFKDTITKITQTLTPIAAALGALMIAMDGAIWAAAQSPAQRDDAKKGILYVMIGLTLLSSAASIINFLLATI